MNATRTNSPYWLWIAAIWTGVGLIDASETVFPMLLVGMQHAWVSLFVTLILVWLPWALATPLVIHLGRIYPPRRSTASLGWAIHFGAVSAIGLVDAAWTAALEILLNPWAQSPPPGPFTAVWLPKFFYGQLTSFVLYAFILTIDYTLESRQRMARQQMEAAQLNEQLHKARLEALHRQVEPHFMFNSLNAISGLIRNKRNDAAVEMVAALSEFLRSTAEHSGRPQVTLEQEIQSLRPYLEIQKARFAERLQVFLDIPVELLRAQVPSLMLQPLVENAIKHGVSKRAQGGVIQVIAGSSNGTLNLSVANDGPGLDTDWDRRRGIGISNLRARLQIMYGAQFELRLRNRETCGVQASVSLPLAGV